MWRKHSHTVHSSGRLYDTIFRHMHAGLLLKVEFCCAAAVTARTPGRRQSSTTTGVRSCCWTCPRCCSWSPVCTKTASAALTLGLLHSLR